MLLHLLLLVAAFPFSRTQNARLPELLDRTMDTVGNLFQYLHKNQDKINLDTVLGIRIAQDIFGLTKNVCRKKGDHSTEWTRYIETITYAQGLCEGFLTTAIARIESHVITRIQEEGFEGPPMYFLKRIHQLNVAAETISVEAQPFVRRQTPEYFMSLWPMLKPTFWASRIKPTIKIAQPMDVDPKKPVFEMTEEDSDMCISQLLGTDGNPGPCSISPDCWQMMTSLDYTYKNYSLSHQLLYIIIGMQAGCEREMTAFSLIGHQPPPSTLQKLYCSRLLKECQVMARNHFPPSDQDLFMEEATLCGMVGYSQFIRVPWLEQALSWQRRSGCYGESEDTRKFFIRLGHDDSWVQKRDVTRRKRLETPLPNGCLSHKSGVATGYLAINLNYLVHQLFD